MGKTSAAVKNRYNLKAYDRVTIMPKKGSKDRYKAHAERLGKSLTALLADLVEADIARVDAETGIPLAVLAPDEGDAGTSEIRR